jgi:putative CocE/NonD family hydrolase
MRLTVQFDVPMRMRDGTRLLADVYRPAIRARVPVLVMRTPYDKSLAVASPSTDVLRLVRERFAVVVQDVRGRHASDGQFFPFRHETADGADTIAWAAAQAWSTGRVGMIGSSYVGATQWLAAATNPPGLECIAPMVTASDYRDGWVYRGGAFELGFSLLWSLALAQNQVDRARRPRRMAQLLDATDRLEDLYRGLGAGDQRLLDEHAPYYTEWRSHPWPDEGWRLIAPNPRPDATLAPALNVGGWYDIFLSGTLRNYERQRDAAPVGRRPSLIVGPWSHAVFTGRFPGRSFGIRADTDHLGTGPEDENLATIGDARVKWFDRWLRQPPNVEDDGSVRLFVTGLDAWRVLPDWPPAGSQESFFLLASGEANSRNGVGRLERTPPATDEQVQVVQFFPGDPVPTAGGATLMAGAVLGERSGPTDQRAVEERRDVLCFDSEPLPGGLTAIGWVTADLHVATTTNDIDVVAKLIDVQPDGRAELVTDGILRGSQRRPGAPTPLPLEGVERISLEMGATAHYFPHGHRIRVEIAASNFPRFDLNPEATAQGGSTLRVFLDAGRPSQIRLPVVVL